MFNSNPPLQVRTVTTDSFVPSEGGGLLPSFRDGDRRFMQPTLTGEQRERAEKLMLPNKRDKYAYTEEELRDFHDLNNELMKERDIYETREKAPKYVRIPPEFVDGEPLHPL